MAVNEIFPLSALFCIFSALPLPGHCQLWNPYPVMYPKDIGSRADVGKYFQYSKLTVGFTKVVLDNSLDYIPINSGKEPFMDISTLLPRSHPEKTLFLRFDGTEMANATPQLMTMLRQRLKLYDRAHNFYVITALQGPNGKQVKPIDWSTFIPSDGFNATVAFAFDEKFDQNANIKVGYTGEMLLKMQQLLQPFCARPDVRAFVVLDAFLMGIADPDVVKVWKEFKQCSGGFQFVLVNTAGHPAPNLKQVKKLMTNPLDQIRPNLFTVRFTGDMGQRLYSYHFIDWGFVVGHRRALPLLPEHGYSALLDSPTRLFRFALQAVNGVWGNGTSFQTFHLKGQFAGGKGEYYEQVAQTLDRYRLAVLRPTTYEDSVTFLNVTKFRQRPFFDVHIFRGPNAKNFRPDYSFDDLAENSSFLEMIPKVKVLLTFREEKPGGELQYTEEMLEEMVTFTRRSWMRGVRFGVQLDLLYMRKELNLTALLKNANFRWLFLTCDHVEVPTEAMMARTYEWMRMFEDHVVFLLLNDNFALVNRIYQSGRSIAPNGTSTTPSPDLIPTTPTPDDPQPANNTFTYGTTPGVNAAEWQRAEGCFRWFVVGVGLIRMILL